MAEQLPGGLEGPLVLELRYPVNDTKPAEVCFRVYGQQLTDLVLLGKLETEAQ